MSSQNFSESANSSIKAYLVAMKNFYFSQVDNFGEGINNGIKSFITKINDNSFNLKDLKFPGVSYQSPSHNVMFILQAVDSYINSLDPEYLQFAYCNYNHYTEYTQIFTEMLNLHFSKPFEYEFNNEHVVLKSIYDQIKYLQFLSKKYAEVKCTDTIPYQFRSVSSKGTLFTQFAFTKYQCYKD